MTDEPPLLDPPVPPGADLSALPFFPLYFRKLFKSRSWIRASFEGKCAMLRLWCHAFGNEVPAGSLPDDDVLLADYAGYGNNLAAWRKIRAEALQKWERCEADGLLYHKHVTKAVLTALGKGLGGGEAAPKSNDALRQQRTRDRKAALHRQLENLGHKAPKSATVSVLEALLAAITGHRAGAGAGDEITPDRDKGGVTRHGQNVTDHGRVTAQREAEGKAQSEGHEQSLNSENQHAAAAASPAPAAAAPGEGAPPPSPQDWIDQEKNLAIAALAAAGLPRAPSRKDLTTAARWLRNGWGRDKIVQVIGDVVTREGFVSVTVLHYFDEAIRDAVNNPSRRTAAPASVTRHGDEGVTRHAAPALNDDSWRLKLRAYFKALSVSPGEGIRVWGNVFGAQPLHEGHIVPAHILAEPEFAAEIRREQWRRRLRRYQDAAKQGQAVATATWDADTAPEPGGAEPGRPGCRAPAEVLAEFEFADLRRRTGT